MPVIPAWLVRSNLGDPRRIPYLLVWKDERHDSKIMEAVRLAHFIACGREGNDYVELKRTDGSATVLLIVRRMLPSNGGCALFLLCPYCNTPRRHVYGCENSQPTYRYSLLDGVKEGYLINPTVVDARTGITTKLLSEEGFVVSFTDDAGEDQEEAFKQREFEKRFFSDATNQLFCKTFLENALRDPVSAEIGKSIIFAVSQNHAAKLTQILNKMGDRMFPSKYQSDFAVQVTSQVAYFRCSSI